eukprot:scaffold90_cov163-Ochromonas_danica.AAC.27
MPRSLSCDFPSHIPATPRNSNILKLNCCVSTASTQRVTSHPSYSSQRHATSLQPRQHAQIRSILRNFSVMKL